MTRPLSPHEARVLGVLVEKQLTVPDSYPLTLNTLTAGCNQKTAREPLMQLSEADVLAATNGLRDLGLISEVSGSRVPRFEHHAAKGLGVPSQSVALLTMLMLRGPQTPAELRLHTERLHRFADVSSVEAFLEELAAAEPPRAIKLPRAPGTRESRWAHLLSGAPDTSADQASTDNLASVESTHISQSQFEAMQARQNQMEVELADLRRIVQQLSQALGMDEANAGPIA